MIAVTYRLMLEEPVLATALVGEPNSAVSYPFIPGSAMRGIMAGSLIGAAPDTDLPVTRRRMLFDGRVRYLNAYPVDAAGTRCLPVPLSWRRDKARVAPVGGIEDHAVLDPADTSWDTSEALTGFTRVFPSEGDVPAEAEIGIPRRHVAVHFLRDRNAGRPTDSSGTLYRYDALAPGQAFRGAIIAPNYATATAVTAAMPDGTYFVGGASTAGYGRVSLTDVMVDAAWREFHVTSASVAAGESLVVTLLSDAILRNAKGATHTNLREALEALGVSTNTERAFKQVAMVGGFNRKWGLPLPQQLALRAGSVFVLTAARDIDAAAIERLHKEGIGERRVDGFGRVAVGWQRDARLRQVVTVAPVPDRIDNRVHLEGGTAEQARRMVTRRARRDLDRALVSAVIRHSIGDAPPNTLLSRVRIACRSAMADADLGRVSTLFTKEIEDENGRRVPNPHALKPNAMKKFDRARVGEDRLSDWIRELADEPGKVWVLLSASPDRQSLGGQSAGARSAGARSAGARSAGGRSAVGGQRVGGQRVGGQRVGMHWVGSQRTGASPPSMRRV